MLSITWSPRDFTNFETRDTDDREVGNVSFAGGDEMVTALLSQPLLTCGCSTPMSKVRVVGKVVATSTREECSPQIGYEGQWLEQSSGAGGS